MYSDEVEWSWPWCPRLKRVTRKIYEIRSFCMAYRKPPFLFLSTVSVLDVQIALQDTIRTLLSSPSRYGEQGYI